MKIVLSRKGFDSSNGGGAGPIASGPNLGTQNPVFFPPKLPTSSYLPTGDPVFLPIPRSGDPFSYDQISVKNVPLGPTVTQLSAIGNSHPHIPGWCRAHLDPDLDPASVLRLPGWLPSFGSTQGQLRNAQLVPGDLFLFFGLFQEAQAVHQPFTTQWSYVPGSELLHILFGWLQVETVIYPVDPSLVLPSFPWLFQHPHLSQKYWSLTNTNQLFIASQNLHLPFASQAHLPVRSGGGHFSGLQSLSGSSYILTDLTQPISTWKHTRWLLPGWNANPHVIPQCSGFLKTTGWTPSGSDWAVQIQAQGQECVIDLQNQSPLQAAVIEKWIMGLFG
jgi:putative DNA base modification enzyme with NMAD domain